MLTHERGIDAEVLGRLGHLEVAVLLSRGISVSSSLIASINLGEHPVSFIGLRSLLDR